MTASDCKKYELQGCW